MTEPMVTQERVFKVAQTLADKGTEPTILTVQAEMGGGSYLLVGRYLDEWRYAAENKRCEQVELPKTAVDRLMRLGWKVVGLSLVKVH